MSTLILEVSEISLQLVFGIPQYLTVSTNRASNVYYTLDGSDPKNTDNSLLAGSRIYLPTDQNTFIFKCVAFDGENYSDIFSKKYCPSNPSIKNTRKGNESGLVVLDYDDEPVDSLSFDASGNKAQGSSKLFNSVDIVTSRTDYLGGSIPGGTSKDFINFAISKIEEQNQKVSSPNNNNANFDPKAKVILIDGRTEAALNNQSVRLINRPYDNFDYQSKFYIDNDSKFKSIISGNLVNYVYNRDSGEVTFYYYESVESRWIISKQKIESSGINFGQVKFGRKNRLVFEWIQDPVMSKLR